MQLKIIFLFLLSVSIFSADSKETPVEVFQKLRIRQGEMHHSKIQEYFQNKKFKAAIEKSLDFLLVYQEHPLTLSCLKYLSESYRLDDQYEKSIEVDLKIYRENPTLEEGLYSYLQVAKKYVKMGRKEEAIDIFNFITRQMYSKKLSKDAEIELEQIKILDTENLVSEK